MIVSNSSPIVILGKQGMLGLLKKCFKKVIIPESVFDEVMHEKESPEAIALEKTINEGWMEVENITVSAFLRTKNLGQGEKDAISLAAKHRCILLIDDDSAKTYSSILGVEAHGTFYLIYLACLKNFINEEDAKKIINKMIKDGFYVSTELYLKFLDLLNSIK